MNNRTLRSPQEGIPVEELLGELQGLLGRTVSQRESRGKPPLRKMKNKKASSKTGGFDASAAGRNGKHNAATARAHKTKILTSSKCAVGQRSWES